MLVSVSTLLWSKSGHCRLGEDDGGDGASRVELQDMSSPSVNAVDQQKLEGSGAQEGREGAQERERERERMKGGVERKHGEM